MTVAFGPVTATGPAISAGGYVRGSDLPKVRVHHTGGAQAFGGHDHHPVSILRQLHIVDGPAIRDVDCAFASPIASYLAGLRIQHAATAASLVGRHIHPGP